MKKSDLFKNEEEELRKALEAIQKKLVGKRLTYKEVFAVMDEIARNRLGDVLTTYFAASGFAKGFTNKELYHLTRSMVDTGERLSFKGIVADKHSIGGVPGSRTTLIVVPIVAAAGFTVPKSSSRAITSPDGTADDMEVLAPVVLTREKIYKVVKKTNGCIVWGGSFGIAPADDIMIKVEKPLLFESYDKILVSIMAKKVAFGSNHVVIDLPYGKSVKVHRLKDAKILKEKFQYLARQFHIKIKVLIQRTDEPLGRGIGPVLETREALRILQQKSERPLDLEERSLTLAGELLKLCLTDANVNLKKEIKKTHGSSFNWAKNILKNGLAFKKMQEIIRAQGGNPNIDSEDLKTGKFKDTIKAKESGIVRRINTRNLTMVARILGAPEHKTTGVYLNKKLGEEVRKNETICTLYSENMYNLKTGKRSAIRFPIISL
ncbi:MAG: hypothetical protein A2958_00715 [Candidatus Levybacteria bacterium RIFCSPLOWO2_01_FULL_38_13]|nr:MAG: hypothetical protein A2629_00610 [Candidatus Levybacteria bacterium RIFCSPHIGHO2_01_FULL_41_15]OGH34809.1 MAG: hypothetical protein A2958_00715 [Candidatus Levybacteria bacterium RIFCSPLOWO2_01_FULL_38_13]